MPQPLEVLSDVRRGLPSASGIERIRYCPSSFQLESGYPDTQSIYAEKGERIHEVLAGITPIDTLNRSEQKTADIILNIQAELQDKFDMLTAEVENEKRYWYFDEEGRLFSGQLDILLWVNKLGMVIDWKTGYQKVTPARYNPQIHAQVLLARKHKNLSCVIGVVIQPMRNPPYNFWVFTEGEMNEIEETLVPYVREVVSGRRKGFLAGDKQCQFCKAKDNCPARAPKTETISLVEIPKLDPVLADTPVAKGVRLKMFDLIEERINYERSLYYSDLIRDPNAVKGYTISKGANRTEIKDHKKAINRLVKLRQDIREFAEIRYTKLREKFSEEDIEKYFGDLLTTNQYRGSLKEMNRKDYEQQ